MNNDLISRKALLERIEEDAPWWWKNFYSYPIVDMVKEASVIEAEPVRHGGWSDYRINGYDGLHPVYETQCSLCGRYARFTYRFCPHCGARMNGGTYDDYRHDHQ